MKRALLCFVFAAGLAQLADAQATMARIQRTHELRCGVVREDAEYSSEDDHGSRGAFDDELCRAFAVAVLGPNARPAVTAFLDGASAMDALRRGAVDVVATVGLDLSDMNAAGIALSPPVFVDSLGLIVRRSAHVHHAAELSGRKVCFLAQTEAETSVQDWFAERRLDLLPFPFQEEGEMEAAYASHNCVAIAAERTRLATLRASFGSAAQEHVVLPEMLSVDPMASATASADVQWTRLVTAVIEVLLNAEALRIGQGANAAKLTTAQQRVLGTVGQLGTMFGLRRMWAADVIASVGNYGELYERTLGRGAAEPLERGPNRLTTQGGMLMALPLN